MRYWPGFEGTFWVPEKPEDWRVATVTPPIPASEESSPSPMPTCIAQNVFLATSDSEVHQEASPTIIETIEQDFEPEQTNQSESMFSGSVGDTTSALASEIS